MSKIHLFTGYVVPYGFALLALWSGVSLVRNKPPSQWFWNLLGFLQVVLGLQVLVGVVLFLSGLAPPSGSGPVWLHYAYGGLFPAAILVWAHRFSTKHKDVAWLVFGFAALVNFGLTLRAQMTGLGTG